jgi:hypothetical protein
LFGYVTVNTVRNGDNRDDDDDDDDNNNNNNNNLILYYCYAGTTAIRPVTERERQRRHQITMDQQTKPHR